MQKNGTNRFYLIFLLFSLVALVFYLGFLFGHRQKINSSKDIINQLNPNGQKITSISDIQERPILGAAATGTDQNIREVTTYGKVYFIQIGDTQTEIEIRLDNVPNELSTADGSARVQIPDQLQVSIAKRVVNSDGLADYELQSLVSGDGLVDNLTLVSNQNGLRSGQFSGVIDQPLVDQATLETSIERITFTALDPNIQNIFVDSNPDLPTLVAGNDKLNIPGKPAPFFWVEF